MGILWPKNLFTCFNGWQKTPLQAFMASWKTRHKFSQASHKPEKMWLKAKTVDMSKAKQIKLVCYGTCNSHDNETGIMWIFQQQLSQANVTICLSNIDRLMPVDDVYNSSYVHYVGRLFLTIHLPNNCWERRKDYTSIPLNYTSLLTK